MRSQKGKQMKGVVFTQFLEMVEDKFGFDISDEMIEKSGVDGIYTQAGNYPAQDLFAMVKALSEITNIAVEDLVFTYGEHLFSVLITIYPEPVKKYNNTFEFISNVENVVHPEVKKLYPDSDLPTFEMVSMDDKQLKVIYKSTKPLMDFAKGLMIGCAKHYNENITVTYDKPTNVKGEFNALFTLTKE